MLSYQEEVLNQKIRKLMTYLSLKSFNQNYHKSKHKKVFQEVIKIWHQYKKILSLVILQLQIIVSLN